MPVTYSLRCLGGPALFAVSGEQVRFRTRKHLALLVRMALEPGRMFTRDYLTDLLWNTAAPRLANHSLAQGLSVIKAKVAREAVLIQRATVGLAPGWVDVDAQHLTNGDAAIAGPFLDGFDIQAARPFEEWKEEYRAHLLPQLRDCLVRQMDAARRVGDFATVERRAERLHELDPLAEEAVRGIMEARAWAGDRSNALKAFARYEAQLAEELDAKPSGDLCRVADLLRDGRRPTPPVGGGEASAERVERRFEPETLIGREREFSFLYDAWLDARRKHPRIVVVTSDPGVGKTTLANAFVSSCQMDGAVVARAQAYDAERELPFAVLGELVRQLASQRAIGGADPEALSELTRISSEILRVFPGVPKPVEWSPELTPLRIADAFLKTVTAAAEESPVVLIVDDIHAADNASTAILHVVARKLADVRVMMILAARTSELRLSGAPAAFTSDSTIQELRTLEMDILSQTAAEQLVHQLLPEPQQSFAPIERLLRASGGNPLAIELLCREWVAHGAASLLHDIEVLDTQPAQSVGIPRTIVTVFNRQSSRLDTSTRASLDLAAVLGRRLAEVELYAAVDLLPGQAAEALSRLNDEGLLREVRGDLEFRNELIRAQAYYSIVATTRHHLHRRVGELLSQRHLPNDKKAHLETAWHFLRGKEPARALRFAHEGSEAFIAVGAPREAEEILRAIGDVGQAPTDLRKTHLLLAKALLDQSKGEQALPYVMRLVADPGLSLRQRAEAAMLSATVEFSLNRESGEGYCEAARIALESAKKTNDPVLVAQALFEIARAGTEVGLAEMVETAEKGIDELAETTPLETVPVAILTKAFCNTFFLNPSAALSRLLAVAGLCKRDGNVAQLSFIYSGIGLARLAMADFDGAFEAYSTAIDFAKKVGDDARTSLVAANLCTLEMNRGRYEEAIAIGTFATDLGQRSGSSHLQLAFTNLVDAYVLAGSLDAARECLDRARTWLRPERRWKFRCGFLSESAAFALIQGNLALAIDLITQLESISQGREEGVPMPGAYWKLRIFKEVHCGRLAAAREMAEHMTSRFRECCTLHFLDVTAAKAWMEQKETGVIGEQTMRDLETFERVGAHGKRALLQAQGFLPSAHSTWHDEPPLGRTEASVRRES